MNKKLLILTMTVCVIIILGSTFSMFATEEGKSSKDFAGNPEYNYILAPNVMDTKKMGSRSISNPIYHVNPAQQPQTSLQNQREVLIQNRYICQ